jgi:hypothetical protein
MPEDFKYDVFLSYSSKDKPVVRPLAERLKKDGLKVWFDEWEIHPGDSIPAKIEAGLEHSRVLVFCMSVNASGAEWAQLESHAFRFRDPMNKERRFIPLRLDDAPIKGFLAQFLDINWRPPDREQEYAKLLEVSRAPAGPGESSNEKDIPGESSSPKSPELPGEPHYRKTPVPKDEWLCGFLEWFYSDCGDNLLTIWGHRFPAVGWKIDSQVLVPFPVTQFRDLSQVISQSSSPANSMSPNQG